jgi:hypothetical protein
MTLVKAQGPPAEPKPTVDSIQQPAKDSPSQPVKQFLKDGGEFSVGDWIMNPSNSGAYAFQVTEKTSPDDFKVQSYNPDGAPDGHPKSVNKSTFALENWEVYQRGGATAPKPTVGSIQQAANEAAAKLKAAQMAAKSVAAAKAHSAKVKQSAQETQDFQVAGVATPLTANEGATVFHKFNKTGAAGKWKKNTPIAKMQSGQVFTDASGNDWLFEGISTDGFLQVRDKDGKQYSLPQKWAGTSKTGKATGGWIHGHIEGD